MTVSVVLCTYNRPDTLAGALRSLCACRPLPEELIVVDQGDDPAATEAQVSALAQAVPRVHCLRDRGVGLGRARNLGWRSATQAIVAFTDDDAEVGAGWIQGIRDVFADPRFRTGMAGGPIRPRYEPGPGTLPIPPEWAYLLPAYDRGETVQRYPEGELPAGVSLAVRRDLLERLGGFDENIGVVAGRRLQIYGEDTDLALRIRRLGFDVVYTPSMAVTHPVPPGRQTESFLRRRLFSQGATDLYLQLRARGRSPARLARLAVRKPLKLAKLLLWDRRRLDPIRYRGRRAYVAGELYMLAKYGLLGSERFE